MATILAHIRVKAGREGAFETLARELHAATHEREAAVLRYEYWRGAEPGTYYGLLGFDDYRGFLTHQTSAHHEAAAPELGRLIEDIRLEWVDPVEGASDLPRTDSQAPPVDADPLTLRYAKAYAAHVAAWWRERRADAPST